MESPGEETTKPVGDQAADMHTVGTSSRVSTNSKHVEGACALPERRKGFEERFVLIDEWLETAS